MLSSLKGYFFYSNFFVALCSATYFAYFCKLSDVDNSLNLLLSFVVFSLTFFSYNFHRFTEIFFKHNTGNERLAWSEHNIKFILYSSVSIVIIGLTIAYQTINIAKSFAILLIPSAIVLLYNLPGNKNLRTIPKLKIYFILSCWMIALVYFPLVYFEKLNTYYALLITFHQSIFFIIILILFDVKDLGEDAPDLKTLPMRIEIERLKKILYTLCILFIVISIIRFYFLHNTNIFIAQQILSAYTLILIYKANKNRKEIFYLFWVESAIIIQPLSYFILDKL